MFLKKKLQLTLNLKNTTNNNTYSNIENIFIQNRQKETKFLVDEGLRWKYLKEVYRSLLTVHPTIVDAERVFFLRVICVPNYVPGLMTFE